MKENPENRPMCNLVFPDATTLEKSQYQSRRQCPFPSLQPEIPHFYFTLARFPREDHFVTILPIYHLGFSDDSDWCPSAFTRFD